MQYVASLSRFVAEQWRARFQVAESDAPDSARSRNFNPTVDPFCDEFHLLEILFRKPNPESSGGFLNQLQFFEFSEARNFERRPEIT